MGEGVAVVDVSAGDAVAAVRRACETTGFLSVVGHDVPEWVAADAVGKAVEFFDLPAEERNALAARGELVEGVPVYRPLESERLAATGGDEAPADLKHSLDWGPAVPGVAWPPRPEGLREALEAYADAVGALAARLRRLMALALGLEEDWFDPYFVGHASSLRVIDYPVPERAPQPGQLRAGAHTDYGFLTILSVEGAPAGLQVSSDAGDWIDVRPPPGGFVVNLGDMAARWTNDRWRATRHRVVVPEGEIGRRQSLVYFHDPRPDAVIECIPTCVDDDRPCGYAPITAIEHVRAQAARALG